jgi:predicted cation transporter
MEHIPQEPIFYMVFGLAAIVLMVLILPFKVKKIEENLEPFFLVMGILAVTVSGLWNLDLVIEALKSPVMIGSLPIGISQVVLVFGLLMYFFNKTFYNCMTWLTNKLGAKFFIFLLVLILGLLSSIISVIVTACVLVEVIATLPIDKKDKIKIVVVTCFSMGLGACLTPIGEPLSTIMVAKLAGPPYNAGFFFPLQVFGKYIIPGVLAIAIFGAFYCGRNLSIKSTGDQLECNDSLRTVIMRAVKVYAFVVALMLLGEGLKPIIIWYFGKIPWWVLYWVNMISAVLDNATLTAIEIGPTMALSQITAIIMGLLIAGGMLIPGNIPNIVAACRLKISMKEWAKIGIPIGSAIMAIYFIILLTVTVLT